MNAQYLYNLEYENESVQTNYQLDSLRKQLHYVSNNSKYYRKLFNKIGLNAIDNLSFEQFRKIPLTNKGNVIDNNNLFLCSNYVDICKTSGSENRHLNFYLSFKDLERLSINESLSYMKLNLDKDDVLYLMTTIDNQFMAGIAYAMGAYKGGFKFIRGGIKKNLGEHIDSILEYNPTVLIVVPSYLLRFLRELEIEDLSKLSFKKIICIGEAIKDSNGEFNDLAKEIINIKSDLKLFSSYASTEMATSCTECIDSTGNHINVGLTYLELIDVNGNPIMESYKIGEIISTPLHVEAMPLIRYSTGDLAYFIFEKCICGRSSPRMSPILGRKNQMIKFKGTSINPYYIITYLMSQGIDTFYIKISHNSISLDEIELFLDIKYNFKFEIIKNKLREILRVSINIILSETSEITNQLFIINQGKRKVNYILDIRQNII